MNKGKEGQGGVVPAGSSDRCVGLRCVLWLWPGHGCGRGVVVGKGVAVMGFLAVVRGVAWWGVAMGGVWLWGGAWLGER